MGRVDVALEEFKGLRAEIVSRQQSQTTVVNVALTITGVVATIAFARQGASPDRVDVLLALPIVLSGLGLTYLNHSHSAMAIGGYIRKCLWRQLAGAAPDKETSSDITVPSWEHYVSKERGYSNLVTRRGALSFIPGLLVFGIPSIAALVINAHHIPGWVPYITGGGGDLRVVWVADFIAVLTSAALVVLVGAGDNEETRHCRDPSTGEVFEHGK